MEQPQEILPGYDSEARVQTLLDSLTLLEVRIRHWRGAFRHGQLLPDRFAADLRRQLADLGQLAKVAEDVMPDAIIEG